LALNKPSIALPTPLRANLYADWEEDRPCRENEPVVRTLRIGGGCASSFSSVTNGTDARGCAFDRRSETVP
jgi:hypothetical protein